MAGSVAGTDFLVMGKRSATGPKRFLSITHITGGPVGAQRNGTPWVVRDLKSKKKRKLDGAASGLG